MPTTTNTIRTGAAAALVGGLLVPLTATPAAAPPAPTGHAWPAVSDEVDDLVTDLVEDQNLPGVGVSVSKDGHLVVSRGYGYADVAEGTPYGEDMRSKAGSNTKPLVTGPAAWLAVTGAGDDPATTPLYGPGGVFGVDEEDLTYAPVHAHFLRTRGLLFQPGTSSTYSNHGYGVLSMVVEEVTGDTFNDYVIDELLAPRGLSPEIEWDFGPVTATTVTPHRRDSDGDPEAYSDVIVNTLGAGAGATAALLGTSRS